jgi:hypothetical protein
LAEAIKIFGGYKVFGIKKIKISLRSPLRPKNNTHKKPLLYKLCVLIFGSQNVNFETMAKG